MNVFKFSWRDFKNQKTKAIFGISGILISVFLLSTVGVLIDSLNYNYLDTATSEAGSADLSITKTISADLSFDPFFSQNLLDDYLNSLDEIDNFFPRISMFVDIFPRGFEDEKRRIIYYGIDSLLEQDSNTLGDLRLCDPDTLEETSDVYYGPIPEGYCIILKNTATILNITVGDYVTLSYTKYSMNLTVDAICVQSLRFSISESNLIISELEQAQNFLDEPNNVNFILASLKNRELIYDTRDISGTTQKILGIGSKIQDFVGYEYIIDLPKMQQLESAESDTIMMETMMSFATFLAMLIAAILINSVLSTSVEERIREFGVMRVLGGKSRENIMMVLIQGLFIGVIGTVIGIIVSIFLVPSFLTWMFSLFDDNRPIPFVVLPETILQNLIIGIGVTLAVSIFPAIKAGKLKITDAIDPFRHTEEGYILKKEGSPNLRTILIGLAISTVGLLIFILFPRIMVTQDMALVSSLFIGLLIAILIGLVFALVGIVPGVEWLLLQLFRPFIKKYHQIVNLSLKRNMRRNTGNVIMFCLSFSFIFFISSFLEIQNQSTISNLEFQYGGDLAIFNQGSIENDNTIDIDFYNALLNTPGIKNAAPILHNSIDFSELISVASLATETTDITQLESLFTNIFDADLKYETFLGSITAFHNVRCGLIGVNQSYVEMSKSKYFIWDEASGSNAEDAFEALFDPNRNDTIIISKNMADLLGVTQINQKIRLTFADPSIDANRHNGNATTMTVVGISGGMPGFWNFRTSALVTSGSGVMCSINNYLNWMDQGSISNQSTAFDKILLNLEDLSTDEIVNVKTLVNDLFNEEYEFLIDDNISKIELLAGDQSTINLIMEIVLTITILIALFGLISTMYSTMQERMFEIGLLRAMGLRASNVSMMFIVESMILMVGSGTMGMAIGSYVAYALMENIAILTEIPVSYLLSIPTLLRTYLLSISLCIFGILFITRKIRKWSIMDIFRQTF